MARILKVEARVIWIDEGSVTPATVENSSSLTSTRFITAVDPIAAVGTGADAAVAAPLPGHITASPRSLHRNYCSETGAYICT